jgi:hypothetical protein
MRRQKSRGRIDKVDIDGGSYIEEKLSCQTSMVRLPGMDLTSRIKFLGLDGWEITKSFWVQVEDCRVSSSCGSLLGEQGYRYLLKIPQSHFPSSPSQEPFSSPTHLWNASQFTILESPQLPNPQSRLNSKPFSQDIFFFSNWRVLLAAAY